MTANVNDCVEAHKTNLRVRRDAQTKRDILVAQLQAADSDLARAETAVQESRGALVKAVEADQ